MASYLVFRDLPGVTRDQYAAAQHAAADAAHRATAADREVTYLGGFFLPGTGRAICVFDAESAADVLAVNPKRESRSPRAAGPNAVHVLEAHGGSMRAIDAGQKLIAVV